MSEYHLDIEQIHTGDLDLFRAARLMGQLPRSSRITKHYCKDLLTFEQHTLVSILDAMNQAAYFSMIAAQQGLSSSTWQKVLRGVPDSTRRPGQEPPVKVVHHVSARDGHAAIEQFKRNAVIRATLAGR